MPPRRPTADQLLEFAQRTKLVNLEVSVERIAESARSLAVDRAGESDGVNILILTGYFIVYPGALQEDDSSKPSP
jgi:hypothetical protein